MAFKKGDPKPPGSGMQKGQKTKRSFLAQEIFSRHDFDPLEEAVKRLKQYGKSMDEKLFLESCLKLAKFKYSELKSIDHSFDPSTLETQELIEETKKLMKELGEIK